MSSAARARHLDRAAGSARYPRGAAAPAARRRRRNCRRHHRAPWRRCCACSCHGDGGLALFNGSPTRSETWQGRDWSCSGPAATAAALALAPQSGFQRLQAGRTVAVVDAGAARRAPTTRSRAHAGTLSFEMSTGKDRLITNCGAPGVGAAAQALPETWKRLMRATAAHSTLDHRRHQLRLARRHQIYARTAPVLPSDPQDRRPAGARRPTAPPWLDMSHDGYRSTHGLIHHRRLSPLAAGGEDLRGGDRLTPVRAIVHRGTTSSLCRSLSPASRRPAPASAAGQARRSCCASGKGGGWRFRADGACGRPGGKRLSRPAGAPRRSEQVVGRTEGGETSVKWAGGTSRAGRKRARKAELLGRLDGSRRPTLRPSYLEAVMTADASLVQPADTSSPRADLRVRQGRGSSISPETSPATAWHWSPPAARRGRCARPGSPVTEVVRAHRLPGNHGRPGEDPAPRRSTAASWPGATAPPPRRHGGPRHRSPSTWWWSTSIPSARPWPGAPGRRLHREHRHRRPRPDPRRGQEPRLRHRGHRPRASTRRSLAELERLTAPSAWICDPAPLRPSAYAHTAAYDAAIAGWLAAEEGERPADSAHVSPRRAQVLRYGENPHQEAASTSPTAGRSNGHDPGPGVATASSSRARRSATTT